jgi:hypothetical protein
MLALCATSCGALNMAPARVWGRLSTRLAASTITEPVGAFDQWTKKKSKPVLDDDLVAQSMQGYVKNMLAEKEKVTVSHGVLSHSLSLEVENLTRMPARFCPF